ncbi:MAG: twin-arginine translocation signal domain-containing protein [Candidatus Electrothrix sp. AUS1_2]|nr:twin-arginine translocation signal domain-containing protein [Candidatus Electrothrix sp. AUS1_2]
MIDRREFLKTSAVAASALVVTSGAKAFAAETEGACSAGIVYTEKEQGQWEGKAGSHAPKATVADGKVSVVTEHPMTEPHFIVRQTLVLEGGKVIGMKTFTSADKPESSFDLPEGYTGKACATSFCNLHDLWVTEFTV